jgi:hypothetical protein
VGTPTLRPLRIGEVLDVSIKLYARNWKTLLALVAVVAVPLQVISTLVSLSTAPDARTVQTSFGTTRTGYDLSPGYYAGIGVVTLIALVVGILATAACFKAVSDAYLGEKPAIRPSLAFVARRLHSVLWVTLLFYLLVAIGLVLLIVPGIYLAVAFIVAIPALLFEDVRGFKALRRSRRLVKGRWWATFGAIAIGYIMSSVLGNILQGLIVAPVFGTGAGDTARIVANGFASVLSAVVVTPFQAALATVIYYDLRVRKEGFDLQLLAERLGLPAPPRESVSSEPPPPAGSEPPFWPPPPGWSPAKE